MGNEQVICPKPCEDKTCPHWERHIEMVVCSNDLRPKTCPPACIPVPSTPASVFLPPDELLTEIATLLETAKFDCGGSDDYAPCNPSILDADNLAKQILLKCHQSEAAEIAELRAEVIECNNEIETLTDFKVRSMDEYEKADAEIAELKAKRRKERGNRDEKRNAKELQKKDMSFHS